jgi:hypothetical protein
MVGGASLADFLSRGGIMAELATTTAPPALLRQLLDWVAARPRSYEETIEAWRTSCPRLPAWEDAFDLGLVRLAGEGPRAGRRVELTAAGRALLGPSTS